MANGDYALSHRAAHEGSAGHTPARRTALAQHAAQVQQCPTQGTDVLSAHPVPPPVVADAEILRQVQREEAGQGEVLRRQGRAHTAGRDDLDMEQHRSMSWAAKQAVPLCARWLQRCSRCSSQRP